MVDDEPIVAKEAYMPFRDRFRFWALTKEGHSHFILKYKIW